VVKAVLNEIELKPTVSTTGVKIKIEDALKRDAQIEAKDITVETSGNMVTLRGHVHTWNEREDAEHAAFSAPGVGSVSNLLTVLIEPWRSLKFAESERHLVGVAPTTKGNLPVRQVRTTQFTPLRASYSPTC